MGYLSERVSYLRGLADGMNLDQTTNEGRILKEMIELLDDLAGSVEDLEEVQEQLSDEASDTEERLSDLENCVYDDDCCCCEDEDEDLYCPFCGEYVDLDEAELNEDCTALICPSCGKEIEIDVDCDCDCDECDDDCCCCHCDKE